MDVFGRISFRNLEVSDILVKETRDISPVEPFNIKTKEELEPFKLSNMYLEADFDSNGLLSSVTYQDKKVTVGIEFVRYGTKKSRETMSGAYLFLPDGDAQVISPEQPNHHVRVIKGSIRSQVICHLPFVIHKVTLHNSPGIHGKCFFVFVFKHLLSLIFRSGWRCFGCRQSSQLGWAI